MKESIRIKKLKEKLSGNVRSLSAAQRAVGYSESYIDTGRIKNTKQYKKMEKDILETLKDKKALVLEGITKAKVEKEAAGRLSSAFSDLAKTEQLLTGGATERVQYVIKRG
jgi:hypothetical protein